MADQDDRGESTTSDDWVFTAVAGGPVNPDLLSQTFERIVTRSGLPRIRFHDLRHTHASLLVRDGVPLKVVSERLGHASAAFTMVTYQHVLPGMQPTPPHDSPNSSEALPMAGRRTR